MNVVTRRLFVSLSMIILMGMVSDGMYAHGDRHNLFNNPGFEEIEGTKLIGWSQYAPQGSKAGLQISSDARTGAYAALVDVGAALKDSNDALARLDWNQSLRANDFDPGVIEPGETYRFSVYYKTEGDPNGRLGVERRPEMSNVYIDLFPSDDWQVASVEFTWPEESSTRVVLGMWAWNATEGKIWFDDAKLEKVDPNQKTEELAQREASTSMSDEFPVPYIDDNQVPRHYIDGADRVVFVDSVPALRAAVEQAGPGDAIVVADGTYADFEPIRLQSKRGTGDKPIVIAAQNIGGTVFAGSLQFIIKDSDYVVIEGFDFRISGNSSGGYTGRRASSAVILDDAYRARITRNRFALQETFGGTSLRDWLSVDGSRGGYNRIDHNLFENKVHNGSFIAVNAPGGDTDRTPRHTRIDHNYFKDMEPLGINGMEAIRLGSAGYRDWAHIDAGTIFEYNLIENADGERSEIISVKDSGNIIRYNTIVETAGSFVLRFGHRTSIYGNYFLGNGKQGTGGVRIYGADQRIFNNYFEGLTRPAITFGRGSIEKPNDMPRGDHYYAGSEYVQMDRVDVVFNTFINNETNFTISGGHPLEPQRTVVANNLMLADKSHVIGWGNMDVVDHEGISWRGNLAHGSARLMIGIDGMTDDAAIRAVDAKVMVSADDITYLAEGSPAVNSSVGSFSYVISDIEGKPRDDAPDVGAFEYAGFPLVSGPLTEADVGPLSLVDRGKLSLDTPSVHLTSIQVDSNDYKDPERISGHAEIQIDGIIIGNIGEEVFIHVIIDGTDLFVGPAEFPVTIPLNTFDLDEGTHSLTVTASMGDQRSSRQESFFVENIRIESPGLESDVSGELPVKLDVRLHESSVNRIRLYVDKQLIFSDSNIPSDFVIDSHQFEDGSHTFVVEIERTSSDVSRVESEFKIDNYWTIDDYLLPPMNFFGESLERLQSVERSDGWIHAIDKEGDFFGDKDRLAVSDDVPQYIVWETPRLTQATITLYSRDGDIGSGKIDLALSVDGENYTDIYYDVSVGEQSTAGWYRVDITTKVTGGEANYFRLTFNKDSGHEDELQIGHVNLIGVR